MNILVFGRFFLGFEDEASASDVGCDNGAGCECHDVQSCRRSEPFDVEPLSCPDIMSVRMTAK